MLAISTHFKVTVRARWCLSLMVLLIGGISTGVAADSQREFPGAGSASTAVDFRTHQGFGLESKAEWLKVNADEQGLRPAGRSSLTQVVSRPLNVPLQEAAPFLAVGPVLEGRLPAGSELEIEVRGSSDGREWSHWYDASHHGHGHSDRHGHDLYFGDPLASTTLSGELVFFEPDTRYIQYRLSFVRGFSGRAPLAESMTLHFISPGETPETMDETMEEKPLPQTSDAMPQTTLPSYVPRSSWGNLSNTGYHSPINVTQLAVHHTVSGNSSSDWAATVRGFYNYHVHSLGWPDIGYNWLVAPTGTIYQGRAHRPNGNTNVLGTHVGGHNSYLMGLSFIGTYTSVNPSSAAIESGARVLAWKAAERNISTNLIRGHRDYNATSCPGNQLYNRLFDTLRPRVQAILDGDGGGGEPEPPYDVLWERADIVGSNPWYFGNDAQRSHAQAGDRLYVVSRHSEEWGPHVMVHSTSDGLGLEDGGASLSTLGVDGGTYALNAIDADESGRLVAGNLVTDMSAQRFRAYYWADEESLPERVVDFSGSLAHRIGDDLTVTGSVASGSATIWAPASNAPVIYRWSMNNGQFNTWPTAIHLSDGAKGALASVAPLEDGSFLWNARGEHLRLYSASGSLKGRVPGGTVARDSHVIDLMGRDGSDLWLAVYQIGSGNENARIVRVPEDNPGDAGTLAVTPTLDENSNVNATGDVVTHLNNDSVDVFVLGTNNGLGAYRIEGMSLDSVGANIFRDVVPPPRGQFKHEIGRPQLESEGSRLEVRTSEPEVGESLSTEGDPAPHRLVR